MEINSYIKEDIEFIEITNDLGFKVTFANLGASIYLVENKGVILNRTIKDLSDFKKLDQYYGKTIGRVSNRMKGSKLSLNDKDYFIEPNEGDNVLHGGKYSLSTRYFTSEVFDEENKVVVVYSYKQKECEDGYPGDLDVVIKYVIPQKNNEIDVYYSASCDKDTVISLTNHTFWTLGSKDLKDCSLYINSSRYIKVNKDNLLPIEIEKNPSVLDFLKPKSITQDIESNLLKGKKLNGYDHYFYLDIIDTLQCALSNKDYHLLIYSDYEGIQIYTSNFDNKCPLYPECESYLYNSVAIEPSDPFNKLHILKKGETYSRYIKYVIVPNV